MMIVRTWCCVLLLAAIASLVAVAPARGRETSFADTLRAEGSDVALNERVIGGVAWTADRSISVTADAFGGVTTTNAAGGALSHPIPRMVGVYVLKAEIKPPSTGSLSIGLGNEKMPSDYYAASVISVGVAKGGVYEVRTGKGGPLKAGSEKEYGGLNADGAVVIELTYDSATARLSVLLNGKAVVQNVDVSAKITTPRIAAVGARINGPATPGELRIRNYALTMRSAATSGLSVRNSMELFLTPDAPSTLTFKADSVEGDRLAYDLLDYTGKPVRSGEATVNADGVVSTELTLPTGYYEIRFKPTGETFSMICGAPVAAGDAYFGMDAGLTWLESRQPVREQLIAILKRSGISVVRERLSWGNLHKGSSPTPTIWEGGTRNDTIRAQYAAAGIQLLENMYGGGSRFQHDQKVEYAQKLGTAGVSWRAVVERWSGNWAGTEVWNEPDVIQSPAEQYAPMIKMLAYVHEQTKSSVPIVSGAFTGNTPGAYQDVCAANGMLAYSDGISFHSYSPASDLGALVSNYRKWLAASGRESLPLWLTEAGKPWHLRDRPTDDDAAAASFAVVALASEGKAAGISHYFPFILVSWHLGREHDFGLFAPDLSPLRSMAGYTNAIRVLSGQKYAGDLPTPAGAHSVRVFGDADEQVLVIYTKKLDAQARVTLDLPVTRVLGIDGRALSIGADGSIPVPDGLAFAYARKSDVASQLQTDTPMSKLTRIAAQPVAPRAKAAPVVLTNVIDRAHVKMSSRRYLVDEATAKALGVTTRACNLSDAPVVATLRAVLPDGTTSEPKRVEIPPLGDATATWTLDASKALDVAEVRYVKVEGEIENGATLSPLAIPYVTEGPLATHLSRHPYQLELPIADVASWKPNITGGAMMSMASFEERGWKMDTSFPQTSGRWAYPKFTINAPIDDAKARGVLIRARITNPARNVAVMVRESQTPGFWTNEVFPADGEWHVAYVPFGDFVPEPGNPLMQDAILKPGALKFIQVGFGSDSPENTMEVSHLLIVGQERAP